MSRTLQNLPALALAALFSATGAAAAEAMTFYQWKMRPLVVFAGTAGDPALARQRDIVKSLRPAFIDRKMVVVYVAADLVSADLGPPPKEPAATLRQKLGVGAEQFRAILIGLDGTVKLTSAAPIPGERLFAAIDGRPERRDEKRSR